MGDTRTVASFRVQSTARERHTSLRLDIGDNGPQAVDHISGDKLQPNVRSARNDQQVLAARESAGNHRPH